jgi:RND family efflux transporter MFP subunit
LDKDPLQYEVERAAASLSEARAANENAQANLERQQQLFERGTITKVALDASQTQADQANARETSANAAFETANRNLSMSELKAPFDCTINSVNVASFGNITPGRVVLTMFPTGDFEVSLLVSFEVLGDLSLGMDVKVRPADRLNEVLAGKISEIGQRAEAVSAFPVTVALTEAPTYLRAGMAVEVELDLPVSAQASFAIPVAALALGEIEHLSKVASDGSERKARVFVFNPENSTVGAQDIVIAGISGSNLIVTDGVSPGERIVAAGAALLFDGQAVTLWRGGN